VFNYDLSWIITYKLYYYYYIFTFAFIVVIELLSSQKAGIVFVFIIYLMNAINQCISNKLYNNTYTKQIKHNIIKFSVTSSNQINKN